VSRRLAIALAALVGTVTVSAVAGHAAGPALTFRVYARGLPRLNGIVWTGSRFLYVENTANTLWSAPAAGVPLRRFASMPKLVEETRCVRSPGTHGFAPHVIFCHAPNHTIYEISADGKTKKVFATLPATYPPASDGALAFDGIGQFGYRLLAATGRSGGPQPAGGTVYAIDPSGNVQEIGGYPGPGGADQLMVAPRGFGSASGAVLLTVDAAASGGNLVAMTPTGSTTAIASFKDGPNPILAIPPAPSQRRGAPPPGLYLTDDLSSFLYTASLAPLRRYGGDVLVGTERKARFWIVAPQGNGFIEMPVTTNFGPGTHSLEAMIEVR
jgi:hypothetical protein